MVISPAFWFGRRVFLTGHTGFKGAWLATWLQRMGAEVFGYSLPPTVPSLYALADIGSGMAGSVEGDIRDVPALTAALDAAQPEVVIHLAAQAIVLRSYDDPVETFATNVVGTVALLAAVRSVPAVRVVIAVTSDKCYENREWLWGYRENDPMGGHDPYSASKGSAELAVAAMRDSYFPPSAYGSHGVGVASVRAGNVIGGGDWGASRLLPDLMRAVMAGRPCAIRNPGSVRPWQHVLEPLSGYLCLAEALWRDGAGYAGGWNFGPAEANARPVGWIADTIARLWEGAPPWVVDDAPRPAENVYLKLDISKARARLGWSPTWSLETTLQSIVDWYRLYQRGAPVGDCVAAQIDQFCLDAGIAPPRPASPFVGWVSPCETHHLPAASVP